VRERRSVELMTTSALTEWHLLKKISCVFSSFPHASGGNPVFYSCDSRHKRAGMTVNFSTMRLSKCHSGFDLIFLSVLCGLCGKSVYSVGGVRCTSYRANKKVVKYNT
jgi:hypothetical protein